MKVLDHGFVNLVDYMGDDSSIVKAARVSYGSGTKTNREDADLIDYLYRHEHMSPFEMVEFVFEIRAPIFVARQLFRHRTASANEESARYSQMLDLYYVPETDRVNKQAKHNKQGSTTEVLKNAFAVQKDIITISDDANSLYNDLLDQGLARELARAVKTLNSYTTFIWKQDLRNLLHLINLRLDDHAQYEIRQYASAISSYVEAKVPLTYKVFEEYTLRGSRFSSTERNIITKLLENHSNEDIQEILDVFALKGRKKEEFLSKIYRSL